MLHVQRAKLRPHAHGGGGRGAAIQWLIQCPVHHLESESDSDSFVQAAGDQRFSEGRAFPPSPPCKRSWEFWQPSQKILAAVCPVPFIVLLLASPFPPKASSPPTAKAAKAETLGCVKSVRPTEGFVEMQAREEEQLLLGGTRGSSWER